jgi:hypothetical protein
MSHIVEVQTECRDPVAVAAACTRLGLPEPIRGTATFYSGQAEGLLVQLPGWRYPAVVDTATGTVRHDHFGGRWGDPAELGRFVQAYALVKASAEARRLGHAVAERALPNGSILLSITVGGGP